MVRRRLQLFIRRQLRHLWEWMVQFRDSTRQPLQVLTAFLVGAQIRSLLFVVVGIIGFGTGGYMVIEGWNFIDSLYMTMITITTVGFGETFPLGDMGRVFTILLIVLSVTVLAYGLSSSVEYVVTGELITFVAEKERTNMIHDLQNHFIVAGFGRVGQEVAAALEQEEIEFVVVDQMMDVLEKAKSMHYLVIQGSATEDDVLIEAGIERARGVICATGDDAINVFVSLTARGLNPNLFIISRASEENSETKMMRAGADRVISPYTLSGRRMANLAVRPYVVNFLDVTGSAGELQKTLEEIIVEEGSIIGNRTLGEIDLRNRTGALILGLYRSTGELLTSPSADTLLEHGTRMIVLGTRDELDVTEALARNFTNLTEIHRES